jgi:hypothetical protein
LNILGAINISQQNNKSCYYLTFSEKEKTHILSSAHNSLSSGPQWTGSAQPHEQARPNSAADRPSVACPNVTWPFYKRDPRFSLNKPAVLRHYSYESQNSQINPGRTRILTEVLLLLPGREQRRRPAPAGSG